MGSFYQGESRAISHASSPGCRREKNFREEKDECAEEHKDKSALH